MYNGLANAKASPATVPSTRALAHCSNLAAPRVGKYVNAVSEDDERNETRCGILVTNAARRMRMSQGI